MASYGRAAGGGLSLSGTWAAGYNLYAADASGAIAADSAFTRVSAGVYSLTTLTATTSLISSASLAATNLITHTPTHTMASANASVLDRFTVPAGSTVTLTGGTAIGSAAGANNVGFNLYALYQPTITSSSATAVGVALTQAGAGYDGVPATMYIENPVLGGSVTFPGGSYALRLRNKDALAAVSDVLCVEHYTSGTPDTTSGPAILLRHQDASKTAGGENCVRLQGGWQTATAGSERSQLSIWTRPTSGAALARACNIWTATASLNIDAAANTTMTLGLAAGVSNIDAIQFNATTGLLNASADQYINIDSNNSGTGNKLVIGHNAATGSATALWTFLDDGSLTANTTTAIIDLSTGTGNVMKFAADATDPTGGGGAATGRIPINIGGGTKYLAYY